MRIKLNGWQRLWESIRIKCRILGQFTVTATRYSPDLVFLSIFCVILLFPSKSGYSFDFKLTQNQIDEAIAEGEKDGKMGLNILERSKPWEFGISVRKRGKIFGSKDGVIHTKYFEILEEAARKQKRFEKISAEDISKILYSEMIFFDVLIEGNSIDFADESGMVIQQNGQIIKPVKTYVSPTASPSSMWPRNPAYDNYVIGYFKSGSFDSNGRAKIIVLKGAESERIEYDIDFSQYK